MDADQATVVARRVVRALQGRKGFDWWWDDIAPVDRRAIIRELAETIQQPGRRRTVKGEVS